MDQQRAADPEGATRPGRAHPLLDVRLHQLPERPALREALARDLRGSGPSRGGDPHARAGHRARSGERACGRAGQRRHVPRRDRRGLQDLGRVPQPVLAGVLLGGPCGPDPFHALWRRRVRRAGTRHPRAPAELGDLAIEIALLVWFVVGAGIAAGAFIISRSAIQTASVAYNVLEKRLDPRVATRQTILLTLGGLAAVVATSIIAGIAILAMLQGLINSSGLN